MPESRKMTLLADITAPYSALEAWFYDTCIAPAVARVASEVKKRSFGAVPTNGWILDVGCGGGHLIADLASHRTRAGVVGVDLSLAQCRRAHRRTRFARRRCFVACASALALPFPDESFDAVVSVASIKHWPDRRRGMEEMLRVLRPGGSFLVVEADRGCRDEDVYAFVRLWRFPRALSPLAAAFYRVAVAGRSIDLDDARALLRPLPVEAPEVARLEGVPALQIRGRKARSRAARARRR